MNFWRRSKSRSWYKKLWDEWRQLFVSLTTVFGMLGGAYAYVAVDTTSFIDTTEIVAAADSNFLYVQIDTATDLPEQTYIIVNLDGQQVKALVYPRGVNEGSIIMQIPIPFTSANSYLKVNVEIVIVGPRTLFIPQTLETTIDVEKQNGTTSNSIRIGNGTVSSNNGFWI